MISRLNQLISITESLTTLTSVQRQELVKLFRMTIDMIILRTNQLSTEFINKCTRLVNSNQNLIMAVTSNEQQLSQALHPFPFPRPLQPPQLHPQPLLSLPALSNLRTQEDLTSVHQIFKSESMEFFTIRFRTYLHQFLVNQCLKLL